MCIPCVSSVLKTEGDGHHPVPDSSMLTAAEGREFNPLAGPSPISPAEKTLQI